MRPYKDPDEFIKALGAAAYQERINQAENSFMFPFLSVLLEDTMLEKVGMFILSDGGIGCGCCQPVVRNRYITRATQAREGMMARPTNSRE